MLGTLLEAVPQRYVHDVVLEPIGHRGVAIGHLVDGFVLDSVQSQFASAVFLKLLAASINWTCNTHRQVVKLNLHLHLLG